MKLTVLLFAPLLMTTACHAQQRAYVAKTCELYSDSMAIEVVSQTPLQIFMFDATGVTFHIGNYYARPYREVAMDFPTPNSLEIREITDNSAPYTISNVAPQCKAWLQKNSLLSGQKRPNNSFKPKPLRGSASFWR